MLIEPDDVPAYISWDGPDLRVDRWPVYVNFEKSILRKDDLIDAGGASVLPRGPDSIKARLRRLLRWMTLPDTAIRSNVDRLLAILRAEDAPTVLIIGGGSVGIGLEELYADPCIRLLAFDVYGSPNVQFIADAHEIPIGDGTIDAVVVQAVLEHVLDPRKVVEEIHRVLKTGGFVYAETPFMQQVHEGAYDFTRFTESGHRWLFKEFSRIDSGVVTGLGVQLIWSMDAAISGLFRSSKAGKIFSAAFFWLRFLDRFVPTGQQIDGACCVYFLGQRADRAIAASDMPRHYLGAQ